MTMKPLYFDGDNRPEDDGEPLTKEESLWVWSIIWTFTFAPVVIVYLVTRHL
jgi:hypothetical protein